MVVRREKDYSKSSYRSFFTTTPWVESGGLGGGVGACSDLPWCCVPRAGLGGGGWSLLWPTLMFCAEGRVGWRGLELALTYLDVVLRGEGWVEGVEPALTYLDVVCREQGWVEGVEPALTYLDVVCRGEEGVEGGGTCSGHHCWFCPKAGGRGWDSNSSGVGISTWPRTWPGQKK